MNVSLSTDQSSAKLEKILISYKYIKRRTEESREEKKKKISLCSEVLNSGSYILKKDLLHKVISVSLGFKWGNRLDAGPEVEMFYPGNWRLQITDRLLTGPISWLFLNYNKACRAVAWVVEWVYKLKGHLIPHSSKSRMHETCSRNSFVELECSTLWKGTI